MTQQYVKRAAKYLPLMTLLLQRAATASGQLVVAALTTMLWAAPPTGYKATSFEIMQHAVGRALAPANQVSRLLKYLLDHPVRIERAFTKNIQCHQIV